METQVATQESQLPTNLLLPEPMLGLLRNQQVDWSGKYVFDHAGEVDITATWANGVSMVNVSMRPLPKVSSEGRERVISTLRTLEAAMRPASRVDFAGMLTKLGFHCGLQNKADSIVKAMMADYWDDFGDYPAILIDEACQRWRKMSDPKARFMPGSNDFIELMFYKRQRMERMIERCRALLGEFPSMREERRGVSSFSDLLSQLEGEI